MYDFPIYPQNLNWNCRENWSFIVADDPPRYPFNGLSFYNNTCAYWTMYEQAQDPNRTIGNVTYPTKCQDITKNYFCNIEACKVSP